MDSVERASHPSVDQVKTLLSFLESRPTLAKGIPKSLCSVSKEQTRKEWAQVTMKLNSMDGSRKSTTRWMKYWRDKKSAVKRKAAMCAAARRRVGSGDAEGPMLSTIEKRIAALMMCHAPNIKHQPPHITSDRPLPPVFVSTGVRRRFRANLSTSSPRRLPCFTNSTTKLIRLEERRLALDEQVAKYNIEREQLIAQSALAQAEGMKILGEGMKVVGEGMKALAEAIKKD